jgi:hypothetical protein
MKSIKEGVRCVNNQAIAEKARSEESGVRNQDTGQETKGSSNRVDRIKERTIKKDNPERTLIIPDVRNILSFPPRPSPGPAPAGIQNPRGPTRSWIPACTGMTTGLICPFIHPVWRKEPFHSPAGPPSRGGGRLNPAFPSGGRSGPRCSGRSGSRRRGR